MASVAEEIGPAPRTNWSLCAICQDLKAEKLICPAKTNRMGYVSGYALFSENLVKFYELGCMPVSLNLARFDEGEGIEATLQHQEAKWHKSCHNKFNKLKLERAIKRKADTVLADESDSPVKTRASRGVPICKNVEVCFFCDESEGLVGTLCTKPLHLTLIRKLDIGQQS